MNFLKKGFAQIPFLIFVVASILVASAGISLFLHKQEKSLATIAEPFRETECPPQECPICPESSTCEPEIIIKEVPIEKIIYEEKPIEIIKEVEVIKEVIKEIPTDCLECPVCETYPPCNYSTSDCPICSNCSDEQNLINSLYSQINSLQNQITSLESQVQSLSSENQSLKEQIETTQSIPEESPIEYSDLQVIIKEVPKNITFGSPSTGGTGIKLADFSNMSGRNIEFRRISFTANGNPEFYRFGISWSSSGNNSSQLIVFNINDLYYGEGNESYSPVYNISVATSKQGCKKEFNNCGCDPIIVNVDLSDWILWDKSANKQIELSGEYTITGVYTSCGL